MSLEIQISSSLLLTSANKWQLFFTSRVIFGGIRKFSDKYIVPEKLVAGCAEHLAQIKMCKEMKKEETERERMERLNREHNNIDWVGPHNSDKLSSLRVDGLSSHFSHHKFTFKGKKAEKVSVIKAHIGMLLYDSMQSVNNLCSHCLEMCCRKWLHHFPRWKLTRKV